MVYTIVIHVIKWLIVLLNGFVHVEGKENLPKDKGFVMVAPHRSWLDPVVIGIAVYPLKMITMAKQELFENKVLGWYLRQMGGFPVNREKPGPSVIKYPVKQIKENNKALLIFPTGTRYSNDMKGGAVTIARLSKAPIVPIVFQGPFTFKDILKRQKITVKIGEPIELPKGRLSKEQIAEIDQQIVTTFDRIDKEINPDFVYHIPERKKK